MPVTVAQMTINFTGNTTIAQQNVANLNSSLGNVASNARTAGQSFSTMGVNGGAAFGTVFGLMGALGERMGPLSNAILLVNSGLRSVDGSASLATRSIGALSAVVSGLTAASIAFAVPMRTALNQMEGAVKSVGDDLADYKDRLDDAADTGEHFGFTNAEVYEGLQLLITGFGSTEAALGQFQTMLDLAAKRGSSLTDAAKDLTRINEGYGRGLKELGIDLVLTHTAEGLLETAHKNVASAAERVADATRNLNELIARQADNMAIAALKADDLARAQETLRQAEQSRQDLIKDMELADAVPRISAEEQATKALGDAQQRLADLRERIAAQPPYEEKLPDALDRLKDAQSRLAEAQRKQAEARQLSADDEKKLAADGLDVAEAQARMVNAHGADIKRAQDALTQAIDKQRADIDKARAKMQETATDRSSIERAERAVEAALKAVTDAREADARHAAGTSAEQISQNQQLRRAMEEVAAAEAAIAVGRAKDAAEAAIENERRSRAFRDADEAIAKAQQGVIQVMKDQQAEAIRTAAAARGIEEARRKEKLAYDELADAYRREALAQTALQEEQMKNQKALDEVAKKTQGAADDAAKGWTGSIKRIKAEVQNWLADWGDGIGKAALLAYPLFKIGSLIIGGLEGTAIASAFGGIGTAISGAASAATSALGGFAAAAAVPAAVVVGVGLLGEGISRLTDKIPGDMGKMAKAMTEPAEGVRAIVDGLAGTVNDVAHGRWSDAWDKFSSIPEKFNERVARARAGGVEVMEKWLGGIGDGLSKAYTVSNEWLGKILEDAYDVVFGGIGDILSEIGGLGKKVGEKVAGAATWLWNAGWNMISGFWDGIVKNMSGIWTWLQNLPTYIKRNIGNLWGAMGDVGVDFVKGLWNGINNTWDSFVGWFEDKLNTGLIGKVRGLLGISSPSKVMAEMGGFLMEGLANGINNGLGGVERSMKNVQGTVNGVNLSMRSNPGASLGPNGLLGAGGGGSVVVVNNTTAVTVEGSVWSERELTNVVRDRMIKDGRDNGGNYLAGVA